MTSSMETDDDSEVTTFVSHISALAQLTTPVEENGRVVEVGVQTLINSGMDVANPLNAFTLSVEESGSNVRWARIRPRPEVT